MTKPTRIVIQLPSKSSLKHRRLIRKPVIRKPALITMLTLMSTTSDKDGSEGVKDFLTTGRVGRRNALPDILSDHALTNTADLPDRLMQLTTNDYGESSSKSENENTSSETTESAEKSGSS